MECFSSSGLEPFLVSSYSYDESSNTHTLINIKKSVSQETPDVFYNYTIDIITEKSDHCLNYCFPVPSRNSAEKEDRKTGMGISEKQLRKKEMSRIK